MGRRRTKKRRHPKWDPDGAVERYREELSGDRDGYRYRSPDRRIARREGRRWVRAEERLMFAGSRLVRVTFYADGLVTVSGEPMTPKEFRRKVWAEELSLVPPPGSHVTVGPGRSFTVEDASCAISTEAYLSEVDDIFDRLRGRPDAAGRCLRAIAALVEDDNPRNHRRVERALQDIPAHERVYLLRDMDAKLSPVDMLLSGDAEDKAAAVDYFKEHLPGLLDDYR